MPFRIAYYTKVFPNNKAANMNQETIWIYTYVHGLKMATKISLSRPGWKFSLTGEKLFCACSDPQKSILNYVAWHPEICHFSCDGRKTELRKYQSVRSPGSPGRKCQPRSFVHIWVRREAGIFFVRAMQNFNCSHLSFVLGMSSPAVLPFFQEDGLISCRCSPLFSRSLSHLRHEWMGKCHPNSGHRPVPGSGLDFFQRDRKTKNY